MSARPWQVAGMFMLLCIATRPLGAQATKVTTDMTKDLVSAPDQEVLVLTVEYPPGGSDPVHRHNAQTFVYVVEGSIVMGVKGKPEVTLKPGDTFYEAPEDIHSVGRNASKTEKAKFVVFMLKKKGAPATVPAQ